MEGTEHIFILVPLKMDPLICYLRAYSHQAKVGVKAKRNNFKKNFPFSFRDVNGFLIRVHR